MAIQQACRRLSSSGSSRLPSSFANQMFMT